MKVFSKALPTVDLTEFLNFSSIVGQVGREIGFDPTITQNPEVEANKSTLNFKNRVIFDEGGRRYYRGEEETDSYGGFGC